MTVSLAMPFDVCRVCSAGLVFGRGAGVLLGVFLVLSAGCASTNINTDTGLATRVDALVNPLVAANQFSGAIVLSRDGKVVYQRGFGMANQAAGLAFTAHTPADGASLAKTFTAAGVWTLVEEGRVDLDAPVTRYVPEFPHVQTTVRHLLSHSNGLPPDYEFFDPHFAKDEVRTTTALLRVVAKHAPVPSFPPGTRFEYSNLGFDVAALVIERVSGEQYEAFLSKRFFAPLRMKNTFARPARLADWAGVRTLGYRWRQAGWQLFDVFDMEAFLGASNLYFSAFDLGLWASANAGGRALPATVASIGQRPSVVNGQASAINGLSWYCNETGQRCYYTGSLNAFHSLVYWDREHNQSVALTTNSTTPPWVIITLQRQLVDALAGRPLRPDQPTPFIRLTPDTRSGAAGTYAAKGIGVAIIETGAAGLSLRVNCGLKVDMHPVGREIFYVPAMDYWVAFGGGTVPSAMHVRSMFVDATLSRLADPIRAKACQ